MKAAIHKTLHRTKEIWNKKSKVVLISPPFNHWSSTINNWSSRDITLPTKACTVKAMVFPIVTYGCKRWTIKKAEHQSTDAFKLRCWRRLLRIPWTARRSNQSILKGDQPWVFIGRTDAEAEAPILWPPDEKSQLTGKDFDAGEDWKQEEKGMTEDKIVEWYHWLDGHEFEQALGNGEGQENLACYSPWGLKELDTTQWLNNNNILSKAPWRENRIFDNSL